MAGYTCPICGKDFSVPDWLDTQVRCPDCAAPATKAAIGQGTAPIQKASAVDSTPSRGRASGSNNATKPLSASTNSPRPPSKLRFPSMPVRKWLLGRNKFVLFGLIGGLGCFSGAVLGEILLALTFVPPPEPVPTIPQAVCLLIDCSGSMTPWFSWHSKLAEVKDAATKFARAQDLSQSRIAVVGFGGSVHLGSGLTGDQATIDAAIAGLQDGGSTNMTAGLRAASEQIQKTSLPRTILLFTDGMPDSREETISAAEACRRQDIRIIAIATEDADMGYLAQVTGDGSLVIPTTAGSFGQGFSTASQKIYGRSLVESASSDASFGRKLVRVAGWTSLLALGVSIALIAGQNLYLGRPALNLPQGCAGSFGGLAAGFVAGAAGQILFAPFGWLSFFQAAGTLVGWTVLGALVGRGMAYFVPNIAPRRAWIGGAIGGAVGALGFLFASGLSDVLGRLLGAAILGFVLGLLIAIVEAVFRKTWLEVRYGPKESVTINLGEKPVAIGSDSKACTVYAFGAPSVALRYRVVGNLIQCEDVVAETSSTVSPGDQRTVGNVTVTVCGSGA